MFFEKYLKNYKKWFIYDCALHSDVVIYIQELLLYIWVIIHREGKKLHIFTTCGQNQLFKYT